MINFIEDKKLIKDAKEMRNCNFFDKISKTIPKYFISYRKNKMVIPSLSDLKKNYTNIYYFIKEAEFFEIQQYFKKISIEVISSLKKFQPIVINFHGADEPFVHARIIHYEYDNTIWLKQQQKIELLYLELSIINFFKTIWHISKNKKKFYNYIKNTYNYYCYELYPNIFLIRYEGHNDLKGDWTQNCRSTVIWTDWKKKFIILKQLLKKGIHQHLLMKTLFQKQIMNEPILCLLQRKKIPFDGCLTMKADGQLTGICIYKPNTIEFNITNSLINKLPKNSYYHKLI
jgi:hypothetical protein